MEIKTSLEFDLVARAINAFQSESEDIVKDKQGYGYKFADLGALLSYARPLWTKHELSVVQFPTLGSKDNHVGLITRVMHSSQYLQCGMEMEIERLVNKSGKNSTTLAQSAGSVITYMRRYSLQSIFGLASIDDDGQQQVWANAQESSKANGYRKDRFDHKKVMIARIEKLLSEQGKNDEFKLWITKYNFKSINDCDENMLKKCLHKLEIANHSLEQERQIINQGEYDENA